jgi:hypothetical protein
MIDDKEIFINLTEFCQSVKDIWFNVLSEDSIAYRFYALLITM